MSTVARLAGELAALAAASDVEGARLMHETIGRLLAPAPVAEERVGGAAVVDLLDAPETCPVEYLLSWDYCTRLISIGPQQGFVTIMFIPHDRTRNLLALVWVASPLRSLLSATS